MTIRQRLFRMALRSSLLVAATTAAAVWMLLRVNGQVAMIRHHSVEEIKESSHVAEVLSRVTAALGEAIQARDGQDKAALDALRPRLSRDLGEVRDGVHRLALEVGLEADVAKSRADAAQFAEESAEHLQLGGFETEASALEAQWNGLAGVAVEDPRQEIITDLDDRADTLLQAALSYQRSVTQEMLDELAMASSSVNSITQIASFGGASVILLSFFQGAAITRGLASRLERLRDKAGQIGSGDLHARLDVTGDDEIDHVSMAFNAMVNDLRSSRNQLEHDALHDILTGLPNRALFLERVGQRVTDAQRRGDHRYAVMFIDLDHFKLVNDSLGHAAGDGLLKTVAARLTMLMTEFDRENGSRNTIARLGGDEFTVLIERFTSEDSDAFIRDVAARIQAAVRTPIAMETSDLTVTASIGVIVGEASYIDAASLLRDADAALYRAKESGRACHAVFDSGMHESAVIRLRMENDLRRALERGELLLNYQPITDLSSGELLGFEALLRWVRDGKVHSPEDFIPIAEQTGQIVPIGEWVIERACQQLREWRHSTGRPLSISVNVSAKQLLDSNLLRHIRRVLNLNGLEPSSLIVEITESMVVERGMAMETIERIRALGVRVYIDDFGTGQSTLSGLNRYPVDGLKIDRSFVMSSEGRRDHMAVLNAVVKLAHDLNLPVIAEGVETNEQLAMLQGLGCNSAQGFLFSQPISADKAKLLMDSLPQKGSVYRARKVA